MDTTNRNHTTSNCQAARELIPAYSIGATDPHETELVEAALSDCPELVDELAEYLTLSSVMGHVVSGSTDVPKPDTAGLLARIAELDDADIDMPARQVAPPSIPANHTDYTETPSPQPRLVDLPPVQHSQHVQQPPVHHSRSQSQGHHIPQPPYPSTPPQQPQIQVVRRTRWSLVALTIAAAMTLIMAVNVYWMNEVTELRDQQDRLQVALSELEATQDDLLNVNLQQVNHRELTPQFETVNARATVLWNSERSIGSLYVTGLPALDAGMTYQFWLVRDGHSLSLGTFEIDANGVGTLIFDAPEEIENFEAMGISPEPAQGSDEPTSPHVVIGEI